MTDNCAGAAPPCGGVHHQAVLSSIGTIQSILTIPADLRWSYTGGGVHRRGAPDLEITCFSALEAQALADSYRGAAMEIERQIRAKRELQSVLARANGNAPESVS